MLPRDATEEEALILMAYQQFSEETYAAGFYDPHIMVTERFLAEVALYQITEPYEEELLDMVRTLKAAK